jgi:hypothetical protein
MTRSAVYQLRLHPDEKADLARKAEAKGVSIARLIRESTGLTKVLEVTTLSEPDSPKFFSPKLTKLTKQLEAQPGVTPQQAQERARKRLGL